MRAQRLLEIVTLLRRARRPVTAAQLSERFEVSVRTVYRDVVSLQSTGIPIRGEAGVGYQLSRDYDLPPLMFTPAELEALMLGARLVASRADAQTTKDAEDAIAKIREALPRDRREELEHAPLFAPRFSPPVEDSIDLTPLREALRREHKVWLSYRDAKGDLTSRSVWPISIGFFDGGRSLVAWCELREGFRAFRTDRMLAVTKSNDRVPERRQALLARWKEHVSDEIRKGSPAPR